MNETAYRNQLQIDLCKAGIRTWRHVVSLLFTHNGDPIKIGTDGQADLWGCCPVIITPEMVGRKIAVFISIETKSSTGRTDPKRLKKQTDWMNAINDLGGIAIICRPGDDVISLIKNQLK